MGCAYFIIHSPHMEENPSNDLASCRSFAIIRMAWPYQFFLKFLPQVLSLGGSTRHDSTYFGTWTVFTFWISSRVSPFLRYWPLVPWGPWTWRLQLILVSGPESAVSGIITWCIGLAIAVNSCAVKGLASFSDGARTLRETVSYLLSG